MYCKQNLISSFTPQPGKHRKSSQIQRINRRVQLLKQKLKKYKDEADVDKAHLMQISSFGQTFQQRLLTQLQKCKQLKEQKIENSRNQNQYNLRTQNYSEHFTKDINLYNLDSLNSKTKQNQQDNHQNLQQLSSNITKQRQSCFNFDEHKMSQKSAKAFVGKNIKNITSTPKTKNIYLKETFLTSIIFILLGTIFRQYFSIV